MKETDFAFTSVLPMLDKITDVYKEEESFLAVSYEDDLFEIRFKSLSGIDTGLFSMIEIHEDGGVKQLPVRYVEDVEIEEAVGRIGVDEPIMTRKEDDITLGGDYIHNIKSGFYGSIGFFTKKITIKAYGPYEDATCVTSKALVSNNHVIARSDAGNRGEKLNTKEAETIATLHCMIKLSVQSDMDIATGTVGDVSKIKYWEVRDIGVLGDFKLPKKNMAIRKVGAKTGLKEGRITGIGNFKSGRYWYYHVFITTPHFGCKGDSGSLVVDANKNLLGLYTWGEKKDCALGPKGYFFSFISPKVLHTGELVLQTNFTVSNDADDDTTNETIDAVLS